MAIFLSTIPGLSTSIRVKGAIYRIKFVPRDKPYSNGILAIQNGDVAAALRKHPYFGNIITEQVDETPVVQEPEEKKFVAVYPDVTKSQEAIVILAEKHGVTDAAGLKQKAAIKKVAEELNISFPNL